MNQVVTQRFSDLSSGRVVFLDPGTLLDLGARVFPWSRLRDIHPFVVIGVQFDRGACWVVLIQLTSGPGPDRVWIDPRSKFGCRAWVSHSPHAVVDQVWFVPASVRLVDATPPGYADVRPRARWANPRILIDSLRYLVRHALSPCTSTTGTRCAPARR